MLWKFDLEGPSARMMAWASFFVIVVAITILSLLPNEGQSITQWSDKAEHFIAYFALCSSLIIARGRYRFWAAIAAAIMYGIMMEFAQGALAFGRTPSLYDAIANAIGACVGGISALCLLKFRRV